MGISMPVTFTGSGTDLIATFQPDFKSVPFQTQGGHRGGAGAGANTWSDGRSSR